MYSCESWTVRKNEEILYVLTPLRWKGWERFCGFRGQQRKQNRNEWVLNKAGVKRELSCQSKEASILLSHHEETKELPEERYNARNNARFTQARKTMHGLDVTLLFAPFSSQPPCIISRGCHKVKTYQCWAV